MTTPLTPSRKKIGDHEYQLRRFLGDDGDRWFFRVGQLMFAARGQYTSAGDAYVGLLASVDEPTFIAFRDTCLEYTDLIGEDEKGRETVQPLKTNRAHMRGRYLELLELMQAHLDQEFGGPFSVVVERIRAARAAAEAAKAATTDGGSSPSPRG